MIKDILYYILGDFYNVIAQAREAGFISNRTLSLILFILCLDAFGER